MRNFVNLKPLPIELLEGDKNICVRKQLAHYQTLDRRFAGLRPLHLSILHTPLVYSI